MTPNDTPASVTAAAKPPRNLVLCLDGTAGQVRGPGDSNSVRIYELLDLRDPERQLAYYDPGVGTFSSPGAWTPFARWFSRVGGLIWGGGLRQNLGEAYTWLMQTYRPGDRIFVFGFSRGAFTARALTGMLRVIGLMRPGSENQVQYAIALYARRGGEGAIPWKEVHRFSRLFARRVDDRSTIPVHYLGIWDTVKAMGLVRVAPKWPYTRTTPNARRIRHAVSIDERRRPFSEYLFTPEEGDRVRKSEKPEEGEEGEESREVEETQQVEEVWFAGAHADVGGTYPSESELSTITLKWILEGAVEEGLLIRKQAWANVVKKMAASYAVATAHRNHWVWALIVWRRRPVPENAVVHASVRARRDGLEDYRPALPASVTWADEKWAGDA